MFVADCRPSFGWDLRGRRSVRNPASRVKWTSGAAYDQWMGRWSPLLTDEFLNWLSLPPNLRWLDVCCGSGVLTEAIVERFAPVRVAGIDASPQKLNSGKEASGMSWNPSCAAFLASINATLSRLLFVEFSLTISGGEAPFRPRFHLPNPAYPACHSPCAQHEFLSRATTQ